MEEINNLLMTDISCDHSVKLLQKAITSIESYPTLYEIRKLEEQPMVNKKEQNEIKQDFNFYQKQLNNSNLNKIKSLLSEIEITLNLIYKTKYNDITKNKIEIINNHIIKDLYNEEIFELENKLSKQKEELRKELNKLDKTLNCNLSFTREGDKIILDENIETKTSVKELFETVSIDKIIDEIDLENYKVIYYKELYGDPLDIEYNNLFLSKENKNYLREHTYPILKVIKKLKTYYPNKYSELEKQSIRTSNIAIKVAQLENLNETIKAYNFKRLSNYLSKSINSLNKVINHNTIIITNIINNIIPKENEIYKLDEQEQEFILDILNELLNITSEEAQIQCKYQDYGSYTKEAVSNYQQFLLTKKYNINFYVEKILTAIKERKSRKNQKSIADAPKTSLSKKIRKVRVLTKKNSSD